MSYYRRRAPELWEEIAAVAAGAAAGVATYYVARVLLGREPLPRRDEDPELREGPSSPTDRPGGGAETGANR